MNCKEMLKRSRLISSLFFWGRLRVKPWIRKALGQKSTVAAGIPSEQAFSVCVAFICDDMTWDTFAPLCEKAVYLTPDTWRETLAENQPDMLFCESAWHGLSSCGQAWQSRIFRNQSLCFDNRRDLLKILGYCREKHIPTVFWNKEDPAYQEDAFHDFTDTALRFDHIFTTAQECLPRYQSLGHPSVRVMQFGFSPALFNPLGRKTDAEGAVYAGSWFPEHARRCEDALAIFALLQKMNTSLTIYDRQAMSGTSTFPAKYAPCVRPAVDYSQLGAVYRANALGVNVNTITDSQTMYARRVFEMMACALPIVSNDSAGMRSRFGDAVCFLGDPVPHRPTRQKAQALLRDVFLHDTVLRRFSDLLEAIGQLPAERTPCLHVFCTGEKSCALFEQIAWPSKRLHETFSSLEGATARLDDVWIALTERSMVPDISFWMTQRVFLPKDCGVGSGGIPYTIEETAETADILWPWEALRHAAPRRVYWAG